MHSLDELFARVSNLIYSRNLNESSNISFSLEDIEVYLIYLLRSTFDRNAHAVKFQ